MEKICYRTLRAKNAPQETKTEFWEQFQKDRLNPILFFDGEIPDFANFSAWLSAKDKDARFVTGGTGEVKALYWLNNPIGKNAMIHFCFLRKAFGEQEAIGLHVVESLLHCKNGSGEYVLSALVGITPKPYRHALAFIRKLGFRIVAELPQACYFARQNTYKNALVSILTKEEIPTKEVQMGGGGKHYSAPVAQEVEIPAPAPVEADQSVKEAADEERRRRAGAFGHSKTVLTSGSGLTSPANSQKKTLLGA